MTIKLFAFLRRVEGVSLAEFHDYWREVHGPGIRDTPSRARHLLRYEQNARIDVDFGQPRFDADGAVREFDGVAVQWFDDVAAFHAFAQEPTSPDEREEEARYLDAAATTWLLTHDAEVIVDKPGRRAEAGLKLVAMVGRSSAFAPDDFHRHWREHHGGLFQRLPDLNEPLLGYDQNHGLDTDNDYDGVTEQWFESLDAWFASLAAPSIAAEVDPDTAHFLDADRIHFILADPPTVMIG